jgi:hypothetical protein
MTGMNEKKQTTMSINTTGEQFYFFTKWTLLSLGIIPLSYIISLIAVLAVHTAFGFNMTEWGTPLSQTLMQIAGGAVIGLGTGVYQRSLLRKLFDVKSSWIYALIIGFTITELIAGIILWKMGLNRGELRFIEFKPIPESLIFACAGLLIGLLQWTILRKYFTKSGFWILASLLGWGICIIVTLISIWAFFIGALLYGAITNATLLWIMQKKKVQR